MIYQYKGKAPNLAEDIFVAPTAVVIGDVTAESNVSIWFGSVVRGDTGIIKIGEGSNIQDNCVVHVNDRFDTLIGSEVTLGHGVIVEGCVIGDGSLIGMGAIVLSGAKVGKGCVVAAGAVVREGQEIPDSSLAAGVPAKVIRQYSPEEAEKIKQIAHHYAAHRLTYRDRLVPVAMP
ncbi:MAG: gamma carbonic anhydrase family protein [Chloroflexota bacterium]